MHAFLAKPLDWLAIQAGRLSVSDACVEKDQAHAARKLLLDPDFFGDSVSAPQDFELQDSGDFRFTSPVTTPFIENNTVFGQIHPCSGAWRKRPTAIFLHGWNATLSYRYLLSWLAKHLANAGVNAARIELPYHMRRQPRRQRQALNFISSDLVQMLDATRQAIADTRAVMAWLTEQGCPRVGLWGLSLGAWIGGLVAGHEPRTGFAVLLTPVARMERVIRELAFCAPVRRSLEEARLKLDRLNLIAQQPRLPPEQILIVESQHDLFAPVETIEEVWQSWNQPEIWRVRHGHISVLMSWSVLRQVNAWMVRAAF